MAIPGNLTTITVTGTFLDPNGNPLVGSVSFAAPTDVYDAAGTAIISRVPYVATLSPSTGAFSITLPCTDNAAMSPTNWGYTITINLTGLASGAYSYTTIGIPHTLGASVDLAALLPPGVPPTPASNTYGLLASANTWAGLQTYQQASNALFLQANVSGDTGYRLTVDTSGKLQWGSGTGATDADLYRSAAGTLKTDGSLVLGNASGVASLTQALTADVALLLQSNTATSTAGFLAQTHNASTSVALKASVSGDTNARLSLTAAGTASLGPGNAATDTVYGRAAAGVLYTSKTLLVGASSALGSNDVGSIQLANATTVPTTNPTGGGVLYAKQAVPLWRDTGGLLLGMVRSYSADASANLSSFTTETDITGASVSVTVTGSSATVIVCGQFDFLCNGAAATFTGFLNWNGSDRSEQAVYIASATGQRATNGRAWLISGVAAGTYTAKLRASCTVSNANNTVNATHTGLTVLVIEG